MLRAGRIKAFGEAIWQWYGNHKRRLPWRDLLEEDGTQRAYKVLVSEIMLQQTQVQRVVMTYKRFLEVFGTLEDLAGASNAEVVRAWRGMGYNSRALRLRDCARTIVGTQSAFPHDMAGLQSLPGIGHYTAAAIRNFAFGISTPCLDTNIRRILHRTCVRAERADGTWHKSDAYLLCLAGEALQRALDRDKPERTTAEWHAALMDFGSLVCTKRNPKCRSCSLAAQGLCKAAYKVRAQKNISATRAEPGREMAGRYVPNRIFRGKIVEELRDAPHGLTLRDIGARVCIDWSPREHEQWLKSIVEKLQRDRLLEGKANGRLYLMRG